MNVPTPHNNAKKGDIAKTVLMPGDPLRCKYIAEKYLENVICYNEVRGMLGFTGEYKGVKVSVQGSGMGIPSMAIYATELFEGYDVENIIRIGSAGALSKDVKLRDIVIAETVDSDSNFLSNNIFENISPKCSDNLLNLIKEIENEEASNIKLGKIFTSDIFYNDLENLKSLSDENVLAVEMETLALYAIANKTKKQAIAMLTISDCPLRGESLSSAERQTSFDEMISLSLELAIKC